MSTIPAAVNTLPSPSSTISRNDWIERESIHACMVSQKNSYILTIIVVPIVFLLLYEYVNLKGLLFWTFFATILTAHRFFFTRHYMKVVAKTSLAEAVVWLKKKTNYLWTWSAVGVLWGSLSWLFFGNAPLFNQFVCWVVLTSICLFSVISYSSHLATLLKFIGALLFVILCGVLYHYFDSPGSAIASMMLYIIPLHMVLWMMLIKIAKQLNTSHIKQMNLIDTINYQKQLAVEAVEAKNRFFASASHDIRQPVLALNLYANLLKSDPSALPIFSEKIETIARYALEMFDNLFELSRLDSGQLVINRQNISIPGILTELDDQYSAIAEAKGLKFKVALGVCDFLYSDYQALKRILGNLVSNAIKFTHSGGVLLTCRQSQDGIRFEVWDTGMGIPLEKQTDVFKEYYKVDAHSRSVEGSGLGLSIVQKLCEKIDATVTMKSRLGRGTMIRVTVPVGFGADQSNPLVRA